MGSLRWESEGSRWMLTARAAEKHVWLREVGEVLRRWLWRLPRPLISSSFIGKLLHTNARRREEC
jgi:hypothetical protein